MGSSTKKHKKDKDSKKKKHRSRSPSSESRDRERRHHKKHKDRKRERSASLDVEEVPVDSHLSPPPEKRPRPTASSASPPAAAESSRNADSLSIQETNRIRAKLGLKPLQLNDEAPADDGKITDDLGEFYHKPADNIAKKTQREKLLTRIAERKEKRLVEQKLQSIRGLGESDDEDEGGAAAWIKKNREITRQKEEAAKRSAILDELDAEFGVSAIAAEMEQGARAEAYTAASLRGLRVMHDADAFGSERSCILTLEDRGVLDDKDDVLVNVNIQDSERYSKSNENKKQVKSGYNPYEGTDDFDQYGMPKDKNLLGKYDEEIYGAKKPEGFVIGDEDGEEARKFRQMMIRQKLSSKRLESLAMPELKQASDYYTEDEIKAKFKKPKKKGKMRTKVKIEDIILGEENDALITDDTDYKDIKVGSLKMEEDEEEDNELEMALAKARRLKQAQQLKLKKPKIEEIAAAIKEDSDEEGYVRGSGGIVLDSTAEFCRTLGDIPTYGQAGNRDVDANQLLELESIEETSTTATATEGTWNSVDVDMETPVDITRDGGGALEAEPVVGAGVGGALQLALSKGYLEQSRTTRAAPPALPHLRAHHYSIDDKAHGDDDKLNRRERGYAGPTSEFREKEGFRPNVKLDYVDDEGRPLRPKEAFRYLSHKFHGKGPGKNKQEKRIKQNQQEGLMKKMNSTDTPLGTLALLQARQKESRAAFVVLSGAKQPRAPL